VKPDDILFISTHRPGLAVQLANRVLVIKRGVVTDDGKPEAVIAKMMAGQVANRAQHRRSVNASQAQMNKGLPNVI
jgi:ATP-binding cassette subfamily C protein LapB